MTNHWHSRLEQPAGILWLGLDQADHRLNVLSAAVLDELETCLDEIHAAPPPPW